MQLNLKKTVIDFLVSNPGHNFTARAMAEWILGNHRLACEAKKSRSTSITNDSELLQQIVAEIGAHRPEIQKQCPQIMTTETRPKQYFYSPASNEEQGEIRIEPSNNTEKKGVLTLKMPVNWANVMAMKLQKKKGFADRSTRNSVDNSHYIEMEN